MHGLYNRLIRLRLIPAIIFGHSRKSTAGERGRLAIILVMFLILWLPSHWLMGAEVAVAPAHAGQAISTAMDARIDTWRHDSAIPADPASETLTLADILRLAAGQNPEIRAAWADYRGKQAAIPAASALDDPQFSWMKVEDDIQTSMPMWKQAFGLSQMFPLSGKLRARGRAARLAAEKAKVYYEMNVRDLVARIKKLYADLWFLTRATRLAEANKKAVDLIAGLGLREQAGDEPILQEALRAQAQQAQVAYDLLSFSELASARQAQLNSLLARPVDTSIIPGDLPVPPGEEDLDRWTALAMEHQEEIRSMSLDVKLAQTEKYLADLNRIPDLTVGYDLMQSEGWKNPSTGLREGKGTMSRGVSFMINIPIWEGRNRSQTRSAQAMEESGRLRLENYKNSIKADLKEMSLLLRNARRLVELYENNLVPQARLAVSTAETDTREKRRSVTDLLEAQSVLYAFQLAAAKARADFFGVWVDVERLIGRIPESHAQAEVHP